MKTIDIAQLLSPDLKSRMRVQDLRLFIENSDVKIVVDNCEGSKQLANNIMRLVQEEFNNKMYL